MHYPKDVGPYKYTFRRLLRRSISNVEKSRGYDSVLDIASAGLKFRGFFAPSATYLAADISPSVFDKFSEDRKTSFRIGDIASNPFFLSGESFDLVVSTHTFTHLTGPNKVVALENLSSVMLSGHSVLVIELKDFELETLSSEINDRFQIIAHYRYRGRVSKLFEARLSKTLLTTRFFRITSLLLSYLDPPPFTDNLLVLEKI